MLARFCRELGLPADRTDQQLAELLDLTDGHPLAMRIMLPELEDHSAGELCRALETNLKSIEEEPARARRNCSQRFNTPCN